MMSIDLRAVHRLTADKKEIKDFSKLPSATYFFRKTLYAIYHGGKSNDYNTKILQ